MRSGSDQPINTLQAIGLMISTVAVSNHVLSIPILLSEAKRDSWLAILLASVPYILWILFLYFISKWMKGSHILLWLNDHYGPVLAWSFNILIVIYLFCISIISVIDTSFWSTSTYLTDTPQWAVVVSIVVLCGFAANAGLQAIAIVNGIILPFVILFGFFVVTANFPNKHFDLLLPLLENGWSPVFQGMFYAGTGFSEIFILLLMQHRISSQIKKTSFFILGLIIVQLTLGPLTGAIAEFGPDEASRFRYPAFEEWRLVKIGRYFEHVDFLSIYQWLSGIFIRISLSLYLFMDFLRIPPGKRPYILVLIGTVIVSFCFLPLDDMTFFSLIKRCYYPVSFIGILTISILLGLLVFYKTRSEGGVFHDSTKKLG